jgi:hypothetical protein
MLSFTHDQIFYFLVSVVVFLASSVSVLFWKYVGRKDEESKRNDKEHDVLFGQCRDIRKENAELKLEVGIVMVKIHHHMQHSEDK